jgi:hypothetical protein
MNGWKLGRENRIKHANDDKLSGHVLGEVANGKNFNIHFSALPTTSLSVRIPIISAGLRRSNCRRMGEGGLLLQNRFEPKVASLMNL